MPSIYKSFTTLLSSLCQCGQNKQKTTITTTKSECFVSTGTFIDEVTEDLTLIGYF